jgi:hypothetical protein
LKLGILLMCFADSSSPQDLQPQHAAAAPKQRTSLAVTTAAINFVDLAGSERAAHSADTGEAEKLRVKEVKTFAIFSCIAHCARGAMQSARCTEGQGRLAHTDTCRACLLITHAAMLTHHTASIRRKQLHFIMDAA